MRADFVSLTSPEQVLINGFDSQCSACAYDKPRVQDVITSYVVGSQAF